MEEEDYLRDQRRRDRGSNFVGSYRRPGSSEFFNPAGDILAGIESVESSIGKRKKTVRDFENAAAIRKQEIIAGIENTEGMSDISAIDSIQAGLMAQVDELHRLDIASFEGDRSAYLKKSNEVNKVVQEIPALMGLIDAAGTTLEEAIMSGKGLDKSVLKSNKQDYYNFVDDARQGGKNISFKIENGNIIAQLDGKDVFNGSAYIKSKEKGFDLINYVKDYGKEMTAIDTEASKNLKSLVKATKIERLSKDGEIITTSQKNDYIDAVEAYKEALKTNIGIDAITNESTFQTYIGSKDQYEASDEQNAQTKEKIIDEMVKKKFPMYDNITGEASGDMSYTEEINKDKMKLDFNKQLADYKAKKQENLLKLQEAFKQKDQKDFEKSLDYFLNRNIYHTKEVSKLEQGSKERANMLVTLLNETGKGKVSAYEVEEGDDGRFRVVDSEGEIVSSLDTPTGVYETLNEFEILDDLESKEVKDKTKIYLNSRANEINQQTSKKQPGSSRVKKKPNQVNNNVTTTTVVNDANNVAEAPVSNDTSNVVDTTTVVDYSNVTTTQAPDNTPVKTTPGNRDLAVENKKQEDIMRNSEVTYGGPNATPLPGYKNYDFGTYLNSTGQVLTEQKDKNGNKIPATYGKSGVAKKGLKTDLGKDVYSGLSASQQSMMRMMHVNIPWDPRVVMLMATGDIKGKDNRSKYLGDYKATTELYNKNKAKFKNIDDQAMFDQWVDIYANTEPNDPGFQKQYKRRVEDMAKAYGFKPTKEQLAKFKV